MARSATNTAPQDIPEYDELGFCNSEGILKDNPNVTVPAY